MGSSLTSESEDSDNGDRVVSRPMDDPPETALLINRQRIVRANWDAVRDFLARLSSRVPQSSFSVRLVSDRTIRRYNKQFRNHPEPTDVLSFPAGENAKQRRGYLGDILISAETARENARQYGLPVEEEIKILVLHGLLHLLGYDHENDGGRMAGLEKRWSATLGLPQNLTGRSRQRPATGRVP